MSIDCITFISFQCYIVAQCHIFGSVELINMFCPGSAENS